MERIPSSSLNRTVYYTPGHDYIATALIDKGCEFYLDGELAVPSNFSKHFRPTPYLPEPRKVLTETLFTKGAPLFVSPLVKHLSSL